MNELSQAVLNMARVNLGLSDAESLLVVTDVPNLVHWTGDSAVLNGILERAAFARETYAILKSTLPAVDFAAYYATGMSGTEPPADIAALLLQYDVALIMTTFSISHTDARQNATAKGCRLASMPGIERSMFLKDGPMAADYSLVRHESKRLAQILTDGAEARVETDAGTNLTFSIAGRSGVADTGIFTQRGEWGNLPGGEAFIAPEEGTANGVLVVQAGWYPRLETDMRIVFKDGFANEVSGGGGVGDRFRHILLEEGLLHRQNCAELGIGTNPLAKRADNVLEAEKIKGTVHIAVGDNAHMGGVNSSDLHEDFVLQRPRLFIDGVRVEL